MSPGQGKSLCCGEIKPGLWCLAWHPRLGKLEVATRGTPEQEERRCCCFTCTAMGQCSQLCCNTPTGLAVELSPRDLGILVLTCRETPDPGVHPGPSPFSTFQHLFAAVAKPSLPFIPICSLQRLLVFPSVALFFFFHM